MNRVNYILILGLFFLSRFFVLTHPPVTELGGYSDVKHDYERYANMWRYGLTPYYEHLYEYPPATIPFVYLPLEIDQQGIGFYYLNYRTQLFIFEMLLFVAMLATLAKLPMTQLSRYLALGFYIVAGVIAKDYWYEGLDLLFFGVVTLALIWRFHTQHKAFWQRVVFWSLFWLSTSIKFLTAPLLLPFALPQLKDWKKEVVAIGLGFMLIWGLPLVYFRSSLAVMYVVHLQRPLKYGAFGTLVIKTVNDYTETEVQSEIAPHFPIVGPVATVVEKVVALTYPLAILIFLTWSCWFLYRQRKLWTKQIWMHQALVRICLTYMLVQFLTAKIFSSPFHIWYVPLLTIFPFANWKQQVGFYLGALWMLLLDTTNKLPAPEGWLLNLVKLERLRDASRFLPMGLMLAWLPKVALPSKGKILS